MKVCVTLVCDHSAFLFQLLINVYYMYAVQYGSNFQVCA